jgi:hypothetical protein
MIGLGPVELIMLMAFGSGGVTNDFVSMIDAKDYFRSRGVEVSPAKLAEIAARDPADGKAQVAQLLALRTLAADAAGVKKSKDYEAILKTVEEIAQGKKGNDPQGFAADYARLAAAALGSKTVKAPANPLPENSARLDALTWFPARVALVGAFDVRSVTAPEIDPGKPVRDLFSKFAPPQVMEEVFKTAEQIGNVRVDRFAIAYAPDPQNRQMSRIYMRFTGKMDHKRMADALKNLIPGAQVKEQKTFRGQRVTLISIPNLPPGFALVGDTDAVIAGFEGDRGNNHLDVVEEMLAVRGGKEKGVLDGTLAASLKKLSPKANGIYAGTFPGEMVRDFTRGPNAFRAFPKSAVADLTRTKDELHVRLHQAPLGSEEEAKGFVEDVERLKKMGIEGIKEAKQKLKQAPPPFPIPPKALDGIIATLESIKVEARGSAVQGKAAVPRETITLLPMMIIGLHGRAGPEFKGAGKEIKEAPTPPPGKNTEPKKKINPGDLPPPPRQDDQSGLDAPATANDADKAGSGSGSEDDSFAAPIPTPGVELPAPSQGFDFSLFSSPHATVRVDVTYLPRDFSRMLPVADAKPWPETQGRASLMRTRGLPDGEAGAYFAGAQKHAAVTGSPSREAAPAALRRLTGRDAGRRGEDWLRFLGPPERGKGYRNQPPPEAGHRP